MGTSPSCCDCIMAPQVYAEPGCVPIMLHHVLYVRDAEHDAIDGDLNCQYDGDGLDRATGGQASGDPNDDVKIELSDIMYKDEIVQLPYTHPEWHLGMNSGLASLDPCVPYLVVAASDSLRMSSTMDWIRTLDRGVWRAQMMVWGTLLGKPEASVVYQYGHASAAYFGKRADAWNADGTWNINMPPSPLRVYIVPIQTSPDWINGHDPMYGSSVPQAVGDQLPVFFRVDDGGAAGGDGNWQVGDPNDYWVRPVEVYFVQEYRHDYKKEVKLEYGDNTYAKGSLDGSRNAPSNGIVYNPGYVYPRVKAFEPIHPPAYCELFNWNNWELRLQTIGTNGVIDTLIVPLERDENAVDGDFVWYWAPDLLNPQNDQSSAPTAIIHSAVVIEGNATGLGEPGGKDVGMQFRDKHWNSPAFTEHPQVVSADNLLLRVDLVDPSGPNPVPDRDPDFARTDGADKLESPNFTYANGTGQSQEGFLRGYTKPLTASALGLILNTTWSTSSIGGFEVVKGEIVKSTLGGYVPYGLAPAYVCAQSNSDILCITAHGGFLNPFRGHQFPTSTTDNQYFGSNVEFSNGNDSFLTDMFMKKLYESAGIPISTGPKEIEQNDKAYCFVSAPDLTEYFNSNTTIYNSSQDDTEWLLLNSCYTLNHFPATRNSFGIQGIYTGGDLLPWYADNGIRYWRKLVEGIPPGYPDDPYAAGRLKGVLGWYGTNHHDFSIELLQKYTSLLHTNAQKNESLWFSSPPDVDREVYMWLEAGAYLLKHPLGNPQEKRVWSKKDYNALGFRIAAIDKHGNYIFLGNPECASYLGNDAIFHRNWFPPPDENRLFTIDRVQIVTYFAQTWDANQDEAESAWSIR